MKIWIDFGHVAQLNFYKNAIILLSEENSIHVTVLDRGRLVKIAQKELSGIPNCQVIPIGKHSGTKWSAFYDANLLRLIQFFKFYNAFRPDIGVGNSFLHGIVCKFYSIPSLMFGDDIGRRFVIFLMTTFATEISYVVNSVKPNYKGKIVTYKALKEWTYLSPDYFKPNQNILLKYSLDDNNYIFVREVITGTLNYSGQDRNLISTIANSFPKNMTVVLSLEDKSSRNLYPEDWILLQEPIEDIHSLIYFSRILVSSGDSMAREASILGVPSIYCGIRSMNANDVMVRKGKLNQLSVSEVPEYLNLFINQSNIINKDEFRNLLKEEWIDVNKYIVDQIKKYKK